ncbi:MAG TPA: GNAT family N-acetyltransferase [Chthonomonadaceae bacterium]|nr:GNAT family N-acetyltransferase [Chthonomonadaceae bacterium]
MIERLETQPLKSGEMLEVVVVTAPDPSLGPEVDALLAHKRDPYQFHLQAALRGETDALETRFYLGLLDGKPVGNIMTVEHQGIGIFGHVYTRPEHRRKGVCSAIMCQQMEHFRQRGGKVLLLGTGFESPAYWIYHSFGFRSLQDGFMRYSPEPEDSFERDWFVPGPVQIAAPAWQHWPLAALLASRPGKELLRSAAWRLYGIGNLEGAYCQFMQARQESDRVDGVVLESAPGAVVGCATVYPSQFGLGAWPEVWVVDVFTHPGFEAHTIELVDALPLPPGKLIAFVDTQAAEKAAALQSCGFEREGTLRRFLRVDGARQDVWIYAKEQDA